MDIEAYRLRKKKTVADLAEMLGVKEAAVYNYKYGKSKPSYESIEKMLLDGAYISEVFSDSVQDKVIMALRECLKAPVLGGQLPPEIANDPDFLAGQNQALKDIEAKIEARITAKLKAKGIDL
jgi:Predicted transcriptional regulator